MIQLLVTLLSHQLHLLQAISLRSHSLSSALNSRLLQSQVALLVVLTMTLKHVPHHLRLTPLTPMIYISMSSSMIRICACSKICACSTLPAATWRSSMQMQSWTETRKDWQHMKSLRKTTLGGAFKDSPLLSGNRCDEYWNSQLALWTEQDRACRVAPAPS